MITLETIQDRLIKEIKSSHMTQTEIAKELNLSKSIISHYVNGNKLPALDTLAKLCKLLGVDANYILCQDL